MLERNGEEGEEERKLTPLCVRHLWAQVGTQGSLRIALSGTHLPHQESRTFYKGEPALGLS